MFALIQERGQRFSWGTSTTPAPDGTKYAKGDDVENVKCAHTPCESTESTNGSTE
jgi:hypothetical protein